MKIGDRIKTSQGRLGTIIKSIGKFPNGYDCLVRLDKPVGLYTDFFEVKKELKKI